MIACDVFKAIVNYFGNSHLWPPHYISITSPLCLCVAIPTSLTAPKKLLQNIRYRSEFCLHGKAKLAATGFSTANTE